MYRGLDQKTLVEPMGFEPTNPNLTPDDSIGLGSPNRQKERI
jgi:hypothetical protein